MFPIGLGMDPFSWLNPKSLGVMFNSGKKGDEGYENKKFDMMKRGWYIQALKIDKVSDRSRNSSTQLVAIQIAEHEVDR